MDEGNKELRRRLQAQAGKKAVDPKMLDELLAQNEDNWKEMGRAGFQIADLFPAGPGRARRARDMGPGS